MKYRFSIAIFFSLLCTLAAAQEHTDNPWQLDVAAGLQSFYAPIKNTEWKRPELLTTVGWGKPLGNKQAFELTLQLGYARNNYHGDALFLQLLGKYQPVIADKIEIGLGLGLGYRLVFYPSQPQKWNGSSGQQDHSLKACCRCLHNSVSVTVHSIFPTTRSGPMLPGRCRPFSAIAPT